MRPFELLVIVATAASVLRNTLLAGFAWPSWSPAMPVAIAVLLVLHLAFEGWREQMLPAYIAVAAWLLLQLVPVPSPSRPSVGWLLAGGAGCLLLAAACGLSFLRPVVQLPAPTGPYALGTTSVPVFADRVSPVFCLWYPAEAGTGTGPAPMMTELRVATRRGVLSRGSAAQDAVLTAGAARLPVLLFFPGWGGVPSHNTVVMQDLASHGYVVVAADSWDPAAYPGDADAAEDLARPLVFGTEAEAAAAADAGERNAPRQAGLARHLLDRLAELNAHDPSGRFTGRLDLDHVGMLGFSFGGSVAVETATIDPRVRAIANLDGGVFTDAYIRGFRQPYLLLSEPPVTEADLRSTDPAVRREVAATLEDEGRLLRFLGRQGGTRVVIDGMAHVNFQDAPLINDWRRVGGRIDPRRGRAIVDAFLLAFFDHHLRGAASDLPDQARTYPEATLLRWPADRRHALNVPRSADNPVAASSVP
jgi:predicted dienelactone hydrolase